IIFKIALMYVTPSAERCSIRFISLRPQNQPWLRFLAIMLIVWTFKSSASAGTISFDPDQHYSTIGGEGGNGNLKGQPTGSNAWNGGVSGPDASILITANEGASGTDQAACTQHGSRSASYSDYFFEPGDSDL